MKVEIEKIFLTSNSNEELFDTFQLAIQNNLDDFELYKTLLANPILSSDEIKLYCHKLCHVFPESSYEYYLWTAQIFECCKSENNCLDYSIDYYYNAAQCNPVKVEPYLMLFNNYNFDVEVATNKKILDLIEEGIKLVDKKSILCRKIAEIYNHKGEVAKTSRFRALAEKYMKENR